MIWRSHINSTLVGLVSGPGVLVHLWAALLTALSDGCLRSIHSDDAGNGTTVSKQLEVVCSRHCRFSEQMSQAALLGFGELILQGCPPARIVASLIARTLPSSTFSTMRS
jgi:hypothetical protein